MIHGEMKTRAGAGRRGLHPPVNPDRVMYGYCRVNYEHERDKFDQYEREMRALAHRHGYMLDRVFQDVTGRVPSVFGQLSNLLLAEDNDVHHVVVPSLDHFSAFEIWQPMVTQYLNFLDVKVWVVK